MQIQDHLIQQFIELIATTLGFRVREQDQAAFLKKLVKRIHDLKLSSLEAYYQLLIPSSSWADRETEWQQLASLLTVTESYFFRDQGQFKLLKNQILPALIDYKKNIGSKTLKIWSAGCSSGEEPYSLAIMLQELNLWDQGWQIQIIGTDVNPSILDVARRGFYPEWSFRGVSSEVRERYFHRYHNGWKINLDIRQTVIFQWDNLVISGAQKSNLQGFDLIICRNVFIYFNAKTVSLVLDRFHKAMNPQSYLLTGHTELHGQPTAKFKAKTFAESVVYQPFEAIQSPQTDLTRPVENLLKPPPKVTRENKNTRENKKSSYPKRDFSTLAPQFSSFDLDQLARLMNAKAYSQVIQQAQALIAQEPQCLKAYCLLAEAYANLGNHAQATHTCQQILKFQPFAVEPVYLLAQICQEQGNQREAKQFLKRVIYLSPTAAYAYFELGCLYAEEGNPSKAEKTWKSALEILKEMQDQTPVSLSKNLTVAELIIAIKQKLRSSNSLSGEP